MKCSNELNWKQFYFIQLQDILQLGLVMVSFVVHSESTFSWTCFITDITEISLVLNMLWFNMFEHIMVILWTIWALKTLPLTWRNTTCRDFCHLWVDQTFNIWRIKGFIQEMILLSIIKTDKNKDFFRRRTFI